MDVTLKTTSFGGYDKKAVENYIDELTAEHEKEVADLRQRTKEGIETARRAGKQIGQKKGAVFTVKKAAVLHGIDSICHTKQTVFINSTV